LIVDQKPRFGFAYSSLEQDGQKWLTIPFKFGQKPIISSQFVRPHFSTLSERNTEKQKKISVFFSLSGYQP
jgi:hypothetical protein